MLYSLLSASAILLAAVQAQTITPVAPGTTVAVTTQAPATGTGTAPVAATTTSAPVVSIPNPPSNIPPVTQSPPVQQQPTVIPAVPTQVIPQVRPQQPPATPQYGYPQQIQPYSFWYPYANIPPVTQTPPVQQQPAYNPYGQQYNPYFGGMVDPRNLNCAFGQCRNRRITMSPSRGFQLNCQQARQCDGLDLTLNVGYDPMNTALGVTEINDLNFDSIQTGVTIRINSLTGNNVEVNNLNCQQIGSCNGLRIIAGFGVEVNNINVHCEMPGACNGCTINGQSCAMIPMMNGNNNNGFMGFGFGYQNAQQQQPQYGFGAPQYPQYQAYPQYPQYAPYAYF